MSAQPDYVPIEDREHGYTAVELAAETLGRDLCRNLWDFMLSEKKAVADQDPIEQEQRLNWLKDHSKALVRRALELLAAANYSSCPAIIAGIGIGDEITVKLTIPADAKGRHDLIDRRKQSVVLVLANPDEYVGKLEEVKTRSKQGDLFPEKAAAVGAALTRDDITDETVIDGLYSAYGVDLRPPVWSRTGDDIKYAARRWYKELDADPRAPMPDVLERFKVNQDGARPDSTTDGG